MNVPVNQPIGLENAAAGAQESKEAIAQLLLAAFDAKEVRAAALEEHRRFSAQLATAAHELLNPLTPIRIAAASIGRARPDELPRLQSIIEHQVWRLSRLVRDLLDVSRIDSDKLRLDKAVVDMADVVAKAVDSWQLATRTRSQRLVFEPPVCRLPVEGDPMRLAQVVGNLLDNASKYTPFGGEIRVSIAGVDANMMMTVSDDGIGIDCEALPHVFESFVQDQHAVAFNAAGLGIGLSVVREVVEAHGGSVIARSEGLGRGAEFVVALPLAQAAEAPGAG